MDARRQPGFTLVELVVTLLIIGVLAAVAVPRFFDAGIQARIAAVKAAHGAVAAASSFAMLKCRLVEGCVAAGQGTGFAGPSGEFHTMYYGFPTGMTRTGGPYPYFGIKDWVQLDGFTAYEVSTQVTEFRYAGAPDPTMCKVSYTEVVPLIQMTTSGC